jgi:hypothetical protein
MSVDFGLEVDNIIIEMNEVKKANIWINPCSLEIYIKINVICFQSEKLKKII